MKSILIIGAGSIGIRLGVTLNEAGHNITLVGRRKLFSLGDFVKLNGVKYSLPKKLKEIPKNKFFDIVFICTKLYDTINIINKIEANNISFTNIIAIQNGLVNHAFYENTFLKNGLTTISIYEGHKITNNEIIFYHQKKLPRHISNNREGEKISNLLKKSGILCITTDTLDNIRAKKLLLNSAVNGLSAIYKMTIGELIEEHKEDMKNLIKESYSILSKKYNIGKEDQIVKEILSILENYSKHFPTTYQDVINNRKTEIDYINGYISSLGKEIGIKTPYNDKIVEMVKSLETEYL